MAAAHVVLLIAVFLAVAVIAAFLITVTYQLHQVSSRLVTILGVIDQVVERTAPLESVITEISNDLGAGHQALEGAVQRLKERKGITTLPGEEAPAHGAPVVPAGPPPHTFRNY